MLTATLKSFRHNELYRVEPYDSKKLAQNLHDDPDEAFLKQYEIDRRSVFVGGLVDGIDEAEIKAYLEEIGEVTGVQLIRKDGPIGMPCSSDHMKRQTPY